MKGVGETCGCKRENLINSKSDAYWLIYPLSHKSIFQDFQDYYIKKLKWLEGMTKFKFVDIEIALQLTWINKLLVFTRVFILCYLLIFAWIFNVLLMIFYWWKVSVNLVKWILPRLLEILYILLFNQNFKKFYFHYHHRVT